MAALVNLYQHQLMVFLLILTRISGLVMTAPLFGSRAAPMRVRAMIALTLSALIAPLHWDQVYFERPPENLVDLAVFIGGEAVIGLALGLGIMILFAGLQISGQIAGQMSGMQLADIFDPGFDTSIPIFTRLLDMVTLAVFLTIGGHRQVIQALLDTFSWIPPGQAGFSPSLLDMMVALATQSFVLGIRAAAPVMVALLLSVLVMGLISRTLPQLNVIAIGFTFNSMVMLATMALSLGAIAWIFQEQVEVALDAIRAALTAT